ncbi:ClpP/crotonase-like domain-containing protein [Talaromyces proteolyticus]|uniref:3-hydroxyisobutyryl-CoA hydrolase n=1 Tax=Talaromyces proteolyticus TaxID=1131652 RepID=A0AAD4L3R7_9EURO|nr:ClpP/crotonase-like domain-containing protein [Talaromyces proteolyticus]KAH8705397.1 ClpP/crotonase-like domain-containing protein [Talaromyces proteolyticus]
MFLRHIPPRLHTPLSWSSRSLVAPMPLRAKVTNPAFGRMLATAPEPPKELPGDEPDDVLFHSHYGVRLIELNRPKKLNSLNGSMARKILPRLLEWEKSQLANVVMVSGAGEKAFCAGGDVAALAKWNQEGPKGQQKSTDYFGLEYQLDHVIATYTKPYVAVMDGITMGGGVGLSVHAPFRIATERTLFAMPETTIGFFPDVGGSFFLSRLDGEVGTYLGLTSERLDGVQALYSGIATHYMHSSVLGNLTNRLSELVFNDSAKLDERLTLVNKTINEFSTGLPQEPILLRYKLRQAIDRCFQHNTIEEIFAALEEEKDQKPWAQKTLKTLSERSPTSLKVTLRQLRLGRDWTIDEAFRREHAIAAHFMRHPDFVEGVSAKLIAKPPKNPEWKPSRLTDVKASDVNEFFKAPEEELALFNRDSYANYPHAKYALPSEDDIGKFVRESEGAGHSIVTEFANTWGQKEGVKAKLTDVLGRRTVKTDDGYKWIE